jgi:hypothetical protein
VSGSTAVFVPTSTDIARVDFFLNDPTMSRAPRQVVRSAPWDCGSTLGNGNAALVRFSPGSRTVTARIVFSDGSSDTLRAVFTAT